MITTEDRNGNFSILQTMQIAEKGSEFFRILNPGGKVHEIRVLNCPDKAGSQFTSTYAGWFDSAEAVRSEIQKIELQSRPPAIYVTLSPANPDFRSRSCNKLIKQRATTTDSDIVRRTHLVVDIDPPRPSGIPSTDEEMNASLEMAKRIRDFLVSLGWPEPLIGMSGNGAYLIFAIDLPNDSDATQLIKNVLLALSERFSDATASIDTSTFNAARIIKLLGTRSRKGDDYPGSLRPHRNSWFRPPNGPLEPVSRDLLESLASEYESAKPTADPQPSVPAGAFTFDEPGTSNAVDRCRAYIAKMPDAVADHGRHNATLNVACETFRFGITGEPGFELLVEFNERCRPQWSERELRYKLSCAEKKVTQAGEVGIRLKEDAVSQPSKPSTEVRTESTIKADAAETTVRAGAILVRLIDKLRTKDVARLIKQYTALQGIEVAPGQITVLATGPGGGKTALAMQIVYDALELNPDLRAVIANAEMDFEVLLRRELTRMTRIPSDAIRFADLDDEQLMQITIASEKLIPRLARVRVMQDPHSLDQLMKLANEPPGILVPDYLQKFAPRDLDPRQGVGLVMGGLRTLAKKGWAIIAISATSRPQKGATKLSMSSLRESSEIEFNADSIYLMNDMGPHDGCEYVRDVTLSCVKNRHGAPRDIDLIFHKPRLEFTSPILERPQSHSESCRPSAFSLPPEDF